MTNETRIQPCRKCDGTGEQVDLTQPDGVADCRGCHGAGGQRVPVTRELVDA